MPVSVIVCFDTPLELSWLCTWHLPCRASIGISWASCMVNSLLLAVFRVKRLVALWILLNRMCVWWLTAIVWLAGTTVQAGSATNQVYYAVRGGADVHVNHATAA
jgi:hypothetical protein